MKITLVGLFNEYNLGDPLLFDCAEYILKELNCNNEIHRVDLFGRSDKADRMSLNSGVFFIYQLIRVVRKIFSLLNCSTIVLDELKWKFGYDKKRLIEIYRREFRNMDGIIVMGAGTLKYDVRLNFAPYYELIVQAAVEENVPVYINGIGVESKYSLKDRRCKMFVKALSNDIVKIITTRDDLSELMKYVKNKNTVLDKVADIGVWAADTFHINNDNTNVIIGLGLITPERFKEFGRLKIYEKYESFWVDLIEELDKKGVKWKIFNNGAKEDILFASELCKKVGKAVEENVITPNSTFELVKVISGFRGIISSRLHSCIVAYSLKVPFVAISWNNKLQNFAREISVSNRIVEEEDFRVEVVIEKLKIAMREGYNNDFYNEFRKTSKKYMEIYMQSMREMRRE